MTYWPERPCVPRRSVVQIWWDLLHLTYGKLLRVLSCQCVFKFFFAPWPWKVGQGHSSSNSSETSMRCICGSNLVALHSTNGKLLWVLCCQCVWKFFCSLTLKSRSRSLIIELVRDLHEMHIWYKFGSPALNQWKVIVSTVLSVCMEVFLLPDLEK